MNSAPTMNSRYLNCFQYFDKFLLTHFQNLLHRMQRKFVGRQLRSDFFAPEFHPKPFLFHIWGESSGDIKTSRVRGTAFNLSQVPSVGFREYSHRHRRRNTHEVSTTMTARYDDHLMIITVISQMNTIIDQYHDQCFDFTMINITNHQD